MTSDLAVATRNKRDSGGHAAYDPDWAGTVLAVASRF